MSIFGKTVNDPLLWVLFSIFDKKIGTYGPPFLAQNVGTAVRQLTQMLQQKSNLTDFPEDFQLEQVGTFHLGTAEIKATGPESVCSVQSVILSIRENAKSMPQAITQ